MKRSGAAMRLKFFILKSTYNEEIVLFQNNLIH
jgi:hypothetical protein